MAAEAAARTREDELRAAMARAGRQHDALLARERGGRAQRPELRYPGEGAAVARGAQSTR